MIVLTHSAKQTRELGTLLAHRLMPGDIVCLFGDLGAGKTMFTKGLAAGLGIPSREVNSPSFVLMHPYTAGKIPLYHFDFYRLKTGAQIADLGYEEFMYADGIAVIEWPERLECLMPRHYLEIKLDIVTPTVRTFRFHGHGKRYADLVRAHTKKS